MRLRTVLADRRLRRQLPVDDLSQRDVGREHSRRRDDQRPMAKGQLPDAARTTFTSRSVEGITLEAAAMRLAFIGRVKPAT